MKYDCCCVSLRFSIDLAREVLSYQVRKSLLFEKKKKILKMVHLERVSLI